ncbi:ribose-phosphate pyrophosphokinase [Thioalkalivibrio sp. ARh3]|uniref:ribose-phosphate diphosphokinase n=1 Tax=Thioalkalivibrio sp. ARh3 TaxID=1158148 RepID=UPI00036A2653|nr:ribose-phosphate pyrophosphokinase [Thioalkalivibrio sp. ARh3]
MRTGAARDAAIYTPIRAPQTFTEGVNMPGNVSDPMLFALEGSREFGGRVAEHMVLPLAEHEERGFEDGEHKARPLESVRERDVYVLHALHSDPERSVNDRLCRLLFFLACVRDSGARRVTAVLPYLGYARKDRRTQPRDPVTMRYLAQLIEAMGADRVMALEVHNPAAYDNAFRCPREHLEMRSLFALHLAPELQPETRVVVCSPDVGGVKRAVRFRERLANQLGREVGDAFFEKARAGGKLTLGRLIGDVSDATVVLVDDLIATGSTLLHAARTCRETGARRVLAVAAHGAFTRGAQDNLASDAFERVLVTDTILPPKIDHEALGQRLEIVSAAPLFAQAITRLHAGGSLTDLQED